MEQEIQNILELIQDYKIEKHSRKCREILGTIEEKLNNICQETNNTGETNETSRTETSNGSNGSNENKEA